jgi:DNA topoisomerase-3
MRVFVAEKPSVARAIASAIGVKQQKDGYIECKDGSIVTNCFGHLLERAEPDYYLPDSVPVNPKTKRKIWRREDLPIIPEKFKKHISSGKSKQVKIIKSLVATASEVVNAGDPDREGQLLVDEVLEYVGYKGKVTRYWQSAMDSVSVKRALNGIVDNSKYYSWGIAAEARGIADWLVGMNYSRQLTIKNHSLISVGRVQTPVLRIVVDRDQAIANFKPKDFFNLECTFKNSNYSYKGKLQIPEDLLDPEGQLTDRNKLNAICTEIQGKTGTVTKANKELKKTQPKLLYTLADLQVDCSRLYGMSAKKTLDIAQELYETHKMTTYPRSSCEYLPKAQIKDVSVILNYLKDGLSEYTKYVAMATNIEGNRVFNDEKVNEAAHTGLAPTPSPVTQAKISALSDDCKKVYFLIVKRYICCFMPPYMYNELTVETRVNSYLFKTTLKSAVQAGFKVFDSQNDKEDETIKELPKITLNDVVKLTEQNVVSGKTTPPKYFTEGTLIQAMRNIAKYIDNAAEKKLLKETDGLGTEATRAEIIERLKAHNFIEVSKTGKTKGKIISTEEGRNALKVIPQKLQSAVLTAHDEEKLRMIQESKLSLSEFVVTKEKELRQTMSEIDKDTTTINNGNDDGYKCPKCGAKLYRNESKYSKGTYYWHCSNHDCGIFLDDLQGKPVERKTCPKCKTGALRRFESKFKKGVYTWCCSNKECKARFKDNNLNVGEEIIVKPKDTSNYKDCPACGAKHSVVKLISKKSGKPFYKCEKCEALFGDKNGEIGNKFN